MEVTCVYGFNHPAERLPLWDFFNGKASCPRPWLVLGDINYVRSCEERISSDPPQLHAMDEFNQALTTAGLEEIRTQGCWFTWTNKQDQNDRKWMRLDRVLANAHLFREFPDSAAEALTAGISDHSPLILTVGSTQHSRKSSFKFLNCWSEDATFKSLVHHEWATYIQGCAMYQLVQHLRRLKGKLKSLHHKSYTGITSKVALLKQQLHDCQQHLQQNPTSQEICLEEETLNQQYTKFHYYI
ncbi:uncharacterized protein LOC141641218 [Silene latifolia]|uniref:uncharacterized protein LOC141641218 n=1 Tax=Silene latifolia TaxID=37657 RepID=UPI003D778EB2